MHVATVMTDTTREELNEAEEVADEVLDETVEEDGVMVVTIVLGEVDVMIIVEDDTSRIVEDDTSTIEEDVVRGMMIEVSE